MDVVAPLLEIRDLEVRFSTLRGVVEALNGVHLVVGQGEVLGLIGESGSGKSVTGYSILGVLPSSPGITAGEIWFAGENLCQAGEPRMRKLRGKSITMISQDPLSSLNPVFSIGEQLVDSITYRGIQTRSAGPRAFLEVLDRITPRARRRFEEASEKAMDGLKAVGMPSPRERMRNYPHEVSGGMRQRVLIAMASLSEPKLLIADEPTTSVDVTVQAQILNLLRQLVDETGVSILYISHDLGVVAQLCDRVAVMYAGQIVESASVRRIFREPTHPYTKALIQVTRLEAGETLVEIPGEVPDMIHLPPGCHFSPRCPEAIAPCERFEPEMCEVGPGHMCKCGKVHGQWKQ